MSNLTKAAGSSERTVCEEIRHTLPGTVLKFVLYAEDTPFGESYSIQCIKYVNGEKVCQSTAPDVSVNAEFASEMYRKIASGEVEPINLHEVVYDLLP